MTPYPSKRRYNRLIPKRFLCWRGMSCGPLSFVAESREIIASAYGDRSENTCRILWDRVPSAYKETIVFSDCWRAYQAFIPTEQHRPGGKETGETAHIER